MTAWLTGVPTTNLRIVVGIALSIIFVLGTMLLSALGRAPAIEYVYVLGGFILVEMGLDVAQFVAKRKTVKPELFAAGLTQEAVTPPVPPGVGTTPIITTDSITVEVPPGASMADASAALRGFGGRVPEQRGILTADVDVALSDDPHAIAAHMRGDGDA